MGNVAGKLTPCLCPANAGEISQRHDISILINPISDDGFGHSFCYIKPDHFSTTTTKKTCPATFLSLNTEASPNTNPNSFDTTPTFFRTISGASISANASTALSTNIFLDSFTMERASSFSSSQSFASVPLQPIPRNSFINSGPLPTVHHSGSAVGSGPIERGFLSGPIERGFTISGPLMSAKLEKIKAKYKITKWGSIKSIKDSILSAFKANDQSSLNFSSQNTGFWDENRGIDDRNESSDGSNNMEYENVQWAEGKAGEDRVHIVVSDDHGWVFVGIYDGFNGPDAPDFLLCNLYSAINKELEGLLGWNYDKKWEYGSVGTSNQSSISKDSSNCYWCVDQDEVKIGSRNSNVSRCDGQILELDEKVREKLSQMGVNWLRKSKHSDVLKALSDALRKTEDAYLDVADKMVKENPELSLMGSCVLAMLMIGEDVYLMNVGDSRAVLGQTSSVVVDDDHECFDDFPTLTPLQLTLDHNTNVKEEVERIRSEHPDDPSAVVSDRVKGSLEVTRAFGAGFLKQPKWNEALLEMFRINYVGTSPYLTCSPALFHHKLSSKDKFIILSSDGLYQYFTNKEAVSEVDLFMVSTPEGDPAQHLIEQVLFRAAKKSGLDFYELLEIPQGERRRYHDDVSVIVISFQGRIWRSSV